MPSPNSIERIVNSYNSSKEYKINSVADPAGAYSRHWSRYYVAESFKWQNLSSNFRPLINFRQPQGLSAGLDDSSAKVSMELFAALEEFCGYDYIYMNLLATNPGNCPYLTKHRGRFLDANRLVHIAWLKIIDELVFRRDPWKNYGIPRVICEIGGGFGDFASLILGSTFAKLILIDMPEANVQSSYFLSQLFPEKRLYLYSDYLEDGKLVGQSILEENDILVLPPWVSFSADLKVGIFVNTRSMMELEDQQVAAYFELIHEHLAVDGYFLNVNRYQKVSRLSKYPYDSSWKVIYSQPSFTQPLIRFLLTKRVGSDVEANIHQHLEQIELFTKQNFNDQGMPVSMQ